MWRKREPLDGAWQAMLRAEKILRPDWVEERRDKVGDAYAEFGDFSDDRRKVVFAELGNSKGASNEV